jgi:adenine deaminase
MVVYEGETIRKMVKTALGEEKADLMVLNGYLINVYTGEIQNNCSVGTKGNKIVYVGGDPGYLIGDMTHVIDASGMYIAPGFIDPHTHLDSIFQCGQYARYAVPHGNTTAISEVSMVANAAGREGVNWFISSSRDLPLRIFILAPPLVPPFPEFETSSGFSFDEFKELIEKDFVVGVGETYWPRVIDLDERATERYTLAQKMGKTREGHAAGARGEKLMAYSASGTSSCHESTTVQEALEKLRLGMVVMIREGYIRRELEAIAPIKDLNVDMRRVMLCTDLADPHMLMHQGCMDELVRRAISCGFDPVTAIQMVTINPADYFCLRELGGIAPGKVADLLLLSDLHEMVVKKVIKDGVVVAEEGALIEDLPPYGCATTVSHTFALDAVKEDDFFISSLRDRAKVRVMDVFNETITKEIQVELQSQKRNLPACPEKDILKMAHISKNSHTIQRGLGFVHGLGIREGAVATSLIWDTNNILVVGATEKEMVVAVSRLLEHQGGFIVVKDESIIAEFPMPICGIISPMRLEEIAQRMMDVEEGCRILGCTISRPFLTLQTLVFTGLPYLRLTDKGLVDIRKREFVDLIIS